jgi:hypothetical protein
MSFIWLFLALWVVCFLLLKLLEGFARSNASGPGYPVNWWANPGWSGGAALLLAFVIQGVLSLF